MPSRPSHGIPRAFIFDLGGVLCDFRTERRLHAFADLTGLTPEAVRARLYDSGFVDRADRGELTLEEELEEGRSLLGLQCDQATYRRLWCTAFSPNRAVMALAQRLHGLSVTAILTNNGPVTLDALRHELSEVGACVHHIYLGAMFGATKPGLAVYRGVEQALQKAANQLVLIDDSIVNVEGARLAGWTGVHFRSAEQLTRELAPMVGW